MRFERDRDGWHFGGFGFDWWIRRNGFTGAREWSVWVMLGPWTFTIADS